MKGGGRKAIAGGAAPGYIEDFIRIMREDIKMTDREAWGEVSGPVETIIKKLNGNFVDASTAAKLLKGKDINTDPSTYYVNQTDNNKNPYITNKHYVRNIAGHPHRKILYGNPPENN